MNRSNTKAEYIRRINKAVEYIENHLDQNLRLEEIAQASFFSAYHFHRIFHALVGETVNEYVSRKRMERAASRLVYKSEMSITDVAVAGGFSSSANFSKSFKLYFGLSPSELRKGQFRNSDYNNKNENNSKIGKLYRKYGKEFNPRDMYSQFVTQVEVFEPHKLEEIIMKVEVETMQEKSIAYLTAPNGYELESLFATWDKIIRWASTIGITENTQERFAICHDNPSVTPIKKCRYDASIVISQDIQVTPPYMQSTIPAGKYAVAYYKDDAEKINNFMTELCSQWFPDSGYEPDNHPPMFNYLNDSREDGYVEMEVYIKIKELVI